MHPDRGWPSKSPNQKREKKNVYKLQIDGQKYVSMKNLTTCSLGHSETKPQSNIIFYSQKRTDIWIAGC